MIAHEDPTALSHSFHEVVTAGADASRPIRQLQSRCLEPGKYAAHLERWLQHFKSQQVHLVDGDELRRDPASVLNRLQRDADIRPFVDYSRRLRFSKKKGFFCEVTEAGKTRCLGRGKGREYSPMQRETELHLREYYRLHNEALVKVLRRLGYAVPGWLEEELKDSGGGGGGAVSAGEEISAVTKEDDHDLAEEKSPAQQARR